MQEINGYPKKTKVFKHIMNTGVLI